MDLTEIEQQVALLDAVLRPIAQRPVDVGRPGWLERLGDRPPAVVEADVVDEAQDTLRALLAAYAAGGEPTRRAIRDLFGRHPSFRWAVHLPDPAETASGLRVQLLHLSARDQQGDTRDEILLLQDLCRRAAGAGVAVAPVVAEVAALSSDVDRYGMGSVRHLLLARHDG